MLGDPVPDDWRNPLMSRPLGSQVPLQRDVLQFPVPLQRRVQFVVLLQLAEHGHADVATTTAICAGADRRDLERALEYLLDEGSIEGPTWRLSTLVALAEAGRMTLTVLGRLRLDEDDV